MGNPSIHCKDDDGRTVDGSRRKRRLDFYLQDWIVAAMNFHPTDRGTLITLVAMMAQKGGPMAIDASRHFRSCGFTSKASFLKSFNKLCDQGTIFEVGGKYWSSILDDFNECALRDRVDIGRPSIPTEVRRAVWARDGQQCVYCGDISGPFALDHYFPWSKGGADTIENLRVSCRRCNSLKSDMLPVEWEGLPR